MNRLARIFVVLFVISMLLPAPRVLAQTPSVAPTRGETVFMDTEIMRISIPTIVDVAGQLVHISVAEIITNILSNVSLTNHQIQLPKLSDYALRFFSAAVNPLAPHVIQQQTIHATENPKRRFYVTGRLCIYNEGDGSFAGDVISSEDIITESENPENAVEFGEGAKFLGAAYSRGRVTQTNGQYDYRKDELTIQTENPLECDKALTTATTQVDTDTGPGYNRFTLSPAVWAARIIVWGYARLCDPNRPLPFPLTGIQCNRYIVRYKGTTLNPWVANTHCNMDGCNDSELTTVDYDVPAQDRQTKGLANTFRPQVLSFTDKLHGGDPAQSIDTSQGTRQGESALSFQGSLQDNSRGVMCSLLPQSLQTEDCQFGGGCGSGQLPDLSVSDQSCKLCNLGNISAYVDDPPGSLFPEGGMPPLMVQILEKAGETFDVPASVILGTLYHEGAFSGGRYQWTEENVRVWSICGGSMPHCNKDDTGRAQPPFGWIPRWFYAGDTWAAVRQVDPSRNRDVISPCNFMDAAFATAKALHTWTGVLAPDAAANSVTACYNWNLTSTTPASCGAWNDNVVAQSQVGYGGYCPQPGKHSAQSYFPDNAPFIQQTMNYYHAFSCGH